MLVTLVSVSWAKLSNEEYMVTSGHTNHLDLLISSDIVVEVLAPKKLLHETNPACSFPHLKLNKLPVTRLLFCRPVRRTRVSKRVLYPYSAL